MSNPEVTPSTPGSEPLDILAITNRAAHTQSQYGYVSGALDTIQAMAARIRYLESRPCYPPGALVVSNFKCAKHGPQTAVPSCPKCLEVPELLANPKEAGQ